MSGYFYFDEKLECPIISLYIPHTRYPKYPYDDMAAAIGSGEEIIP